MHFILKFIFLGVCYGFEIMKYHESPNVPFTILRTRCHEGNAKFILLYSIHIFAYPKTMIQLLLVTRK